jgi:hypothetical protein
VHWLRAEGQLCWAKREAGCVDKAYLHHKGINVATGESGLEGARGYWKIRGSGPAADVDVAGGVDCHGIATTVQVGGVDQRRAGAVQLADKAPADTGLEGTRGGREIGGTSDARDIGVTRGIDRYVPPLVGATSAQVGGVEQGRAGGVQLADKSIEIVAAESGLEGAWGP